MARPRPIGRTRWQWPGTFNRVRAERAVRFIESLPNIKGKWGGTALKLQPWQRRIIEDVFGTLNEDGSRQYRTVYVEIPRKNGKSTIAAGVALYLLFADDEAGGEVYCLDPSTPVLRADLKWTPIGDLVVGDKLIGIDEVGRESRWRKLRETVITDKRVLHAPTIQLRFDDESSVICTPNHRWLVRPPRGLGLRWRPVSSLAVGYRIRAFGTPWVEDSSREAGYLAGLFDGEGYFHAPRAPYSAIRVGMAQNPGLVLSGAVALLESKGFKIKPPRPQGISSAYTLEVTGLYDTLRFLGQIRPSRLVARNGEVWTGKATNRSGGYRTIVEIEQLPEQEVIDISTSTGTYIANGLYSHNSAAHDREQASIAFDIAKEMVKRTSELNGRCNVRDSRKRIDVPRLAGFYRAVERDAAGQHGYNAHGVIFDELHTQRTPDLFDVLTTSGGSRAQPLVFIITTAGHDRHTICWRMHQKARQILDGKIEDPTFYPVIYSAVDDDRSHEDVNWLSRRVWRRANPAYGSFRDVDEMGTAALRAQQDPAFQNEFKRLYLNIWTQADTRLITGKAWDGCAGALGETELEGLPCHGGLDLATTQDIAAFVLLVEHENERQLITRFWCPEERIRHRTYSDGVPYMLWADQGHITPTPGNVIDFDYIEAEILKLAGRYDIRSIRYDRWQAAQIVQHLDAEGLLCLPVGMGFAGLSEPTKDFTRSVLSRQLRHTANPVMDWMIDNLVAETDAAGNMKPSKKRSTERIDGPVAAILATDGLVRQAPETKWVPL